MISSDNFFQESAQRFEEVILELSVTNPELSQPPVPGSQEAEDLERLHSRINDVESLSLADLSAYYNEYGNLPDIDFMNPEK